MRVEKVIVVEGWNGKEVVYRVGEKDVELAVKGLSSSNRYKNRYEAVNGYIKEIMDTGIRFYVEYCEFSKIHHKTVEIPFENIK